MTRLSDMGGNVEKKLLKQAVATAEELGDGLFRVTDPKVLAALPSQQLTQHEEFRSYCQLSQGPADRKHQGGRTRGSASEAEVPVPFALR